MEGGEGSGDGRKPSTSEDLHPLTQPLLFNPPIEDERSAIPSSSAYGEEDSLQYPPISFHHGPRPFRDLIFLFLFLSLAVASFVFGICAAALRNPDFSRVSSFSFDSNSSSCVLSGAYSDPNPSYNFLSLDSSSSLVKNLAWTLAVTLVLAFPILLLLLWLLRHFHKQVVYGSIPFFVLIPALLNVYWFVACTLRNSCSESFPLPYRILVLIFVFLLIGVVGWIIVANWHRIELTSRILGISANALSQNLGLLAVLPSLTVVLLVFYTPLVVFLVFATQNGKIVPKSSSEGHYCVWKQHNWVPAYFTLAILTMLWSLTAMIEAQVYVVSGTIAQWYFSSEDERPRRTIRNSLRNAFGPSFGTVCFSGLVMAIIRVIRAIHDSAKQDDEHRGIITIMLQCCANLLLSAIHFVNKFTINFSAITGEAYCSSAKMAYELLKRNLLSAVFVETVSTRILVGVSFVISSAYAIVAWAILRSLGSRGTSLYLVAGSSFILLMAALGFLIHVLDEVIDTVYVCFAIDRDKGEVSKQEVHSVYVLLPTSRSTRAALPPRGPLLT